LANDKTGGKMPLSTSQALLEAEIISAFTDMRNAGKEDGANPEGLIADLGARIASAIHSYTTSAVVQVNLVNTAVIGASPTGPVVGTGIGVGSGVLL